MMHRTTTAVATSDADVIADQQLDLRHAIEASPALRQRLGSTAYAELLDIVTFLDDAPSVNTVWIDTLYPMVLNSLERAAPQLRQAINRVRRVLEEHRFAGVRLTEEEQRVTSRPWDTWEERRGER